MQLDVREGLGHEQPAQGAGRGVMGQPQGLGGPPRPPGAELLEAVHHLRAAEELLRWPWEPHLARGAQMRAGKRSADDVDSRGQKITYPPDPERRSGFPRVFHSTIASANRLLQNAAHRDHLGKTFNVTGSATRFKRGTTKTGSTTGRWGTSPTARRNDTSSRLQGMGRTPSRRHTTRPATSLG
jgi:hypothetical protein